MTTQTDTSHKQVTVHIPIKCDEGLEDVILALNTWNDNVKTWFSCIGDQIDVTKDGYLLLLVRGEYGFVIFLKEKFFPEWPNMHSVVSVNNPYCKNTVHKLTTEIRLVGGNRKFGTWAVGFGWNTPDQIQPVVKRCQEFLNEKSV